MNIVQYMRIRHNLLIGERTAEYVLMILKPESGRDNTMIVKGRNLITGLPQAVEVTSAEIRKALSDVLPSE